MLTLARDVDLLGRFGRALADPTRCRILLILAQAPAYPGAIAEALQTTRPNVSNHLACLRGCGLVVATPQGRQMRYELADAGIADALGAMLALAVVAEGGEPCTP